MRVEIRPENEEKILQDSAQMGMTPTDYVNYLVTLIEIEAPVQPKLLVKKPSKTPFLRNKLNYRDNY